MLVLIQRDTSEILTGRLTDKCVYPDRLGSTIRKLMAELKRTQDNVKNGIKECGWGGFKFKTSSEQPKIGS